MIDITVWMQNFLQTLNETFSTRVWFVGLQGSYGRGEATETSDIDIVVILDELSAIDIQTYNNMLDSNDALVEQFLNRKMRDDAMFYATSMIYDAYFTMNKDEWLNQENKEYRHATEKRFKEYWLKYKQLHDTIHQDVKTQIIMGIKNRMYAEGMVLETLTFNEWIKQVEEMV